MPTHDYHCDACDHEFEFSKPFGSADHPACPICSSDDTHKRIAPPTIAFKGEGFYVTDSNSGPGPGPEESADTTEATKETTKKETKETEGKKETKTEKKEISSQT